jgi:hypothetical protein
MGPQVAIYATGTHPTIPPKTLQHAASTKPNPNTVCPIMPNVIFCAAVLMLSHSNTICNGDSVVFAVFSLSCTLWIPRASMPVMFSTRRARSCSLDSESIEELSEA